MPVIRNPQLNITVLNIQKTPERTVQIFCTRIVELVTLKLLRGNQLNTLFEKHKLTWSPDAYTHTHIHEESFAAWSHACVCVRQTWVKRLQFSFSYMCFVAWCVGWTGLPALLQLRWEKEKWNDCIKSPFSLVMARLVFKILLLFSK